jgi:hypothetical protein
VLVNGKTVTVVQRGKVPLEAAKHLVSFVKEPALKIGEVTSDVTVYVGISPDTSRCSPRGGRAQCGGDGSGRPRAMTAARGRRCSASAMGIRSSASGKRSTSQRLVRCVRRRDE